MLKKISINTYTAISWPAGSELNAFPSQEYQRFQKSSFIQFQLLKVVSSLSLSIYIYTHVQIINTNFILYG